MERITKRYFSKIPGSRFIMADGFEIFFHGGRFDFDSDRYTGTFMAATQNNQTDIRNGQPLAKVYYEELENLCKNLNPLIYDEKHAVAFVKQKLPDELDPSKNAQSETGILKADASLAGMPGVEMGELNKATSQGDLNASTADPKLAALFANASGPGKSAVDKAREDAALRAAAGAKNGIAS